MRCTMTAPEAQTITTLAAVAQDVAKSSNACICEIYIFPVLPTGEGGCYLAHTHTSLDCEGYHDTPVTAHMSAYGNEIFR